MSERYAGWRNPPDQAFPPVSSTACQGPDCMKTAKMAGLCKGHYQQRYRGSALTPLPRTAESACNGPGCSEPARAKGLCGGHYQQFRRGDELTLLRKTSRTDVRDDQGRKRCSRCGFWLPESDFYPLRSHATRDGLSTSCNLCDRLFRYHITAAEYRSILDSQGGRCAICRRVPLEFHIDHDHACCPERKKSCGKCIRGLLCPDCNGAIGLMADDPQRLLSAAAYLKGGEPCLGQNTDTVP